MKSAVNARKQRPLLQIYCVCGIVAGRRRSQLVLWCVQLQRLTYNSAGDKLTEVAIELYHVRYRVTASDDEADRRQSTVVSDERPSPATDTGSAEPIHRAILSPLSLRYALTNRGGMSAKDGWMCWSAVDRVLCGRLTSSGRVVDVQTLLRHDAVADSICQGIDFYNV